MPILDSFKVVNVGSSSPSFSITKNGITFNKAVIETLKSPKYVVALLNEDTKQMAIQVAERTQKDSQIFVREREYDAPINVRWNFKNFTLSLASMMNWNLSEEKGYQIHGEYFSEELAIIFDFTKALPL